MSKTYSVDFRVYYEDTDAGGIMYHANFINFCERGRSEMLREIGLPASEVTRKLGTGFVVRHLDAEFTAMARLDDLLTVKTALKEMRNSSFIMTQEVINDQNIAAFKMDVTLVCIDMQGKPTRIPDELRQKFDNYL